MKRETFFSVMLFLFTVFALDTWATQRTVSHDAVTTYTDNTPIEANKTVTYSVWYVDNVTGTQTQVANKVTATSHPFNDNVMAKNRLYNFFGQAFLNTGEQSANSPYYGWTVPLGQPKSLGGWTVTTPGQ